MNKLIFASILAVTSVSTFAQYNDIDRRLYEADLYMNQPRHHNAPVYQPAYPNQAVIGGSRCLPPPVPCNYPGVYQPLPYPGSQPGVRVQIGVHGSRGGVWISN